MELAGSLGSTLGLTVPSTVVYDYPSVASLASYLQGLLPKIVPDTEPALAATRTLTATIQPSMDNLAIGATPMTVRYNPDTFFLNYIRMRTVEKGLSRGIILDLIAIIL